MIRATFQETEFRACKIGGKRHFFGKKRRFLAEKRVKIEGC
jgi:hypothetical protein